MDIDMAALLALEREREIPMDVIVPAIEQALLLAYQKEEGAYRRSRVELDRKSGHVVVWAREDGQKQEDGTWSEPWDLRPRRYFLTARGLVLPVIHLRHEVQAYQELRRPDRARQIEQFLWNGSE